MAIYFNTGDSTFEDRYAVLLHIPKAQLDWVMFTFFGLLEYLQYEEHWYAQGETTPQEAAEIFKAIYDGAEFMLWHVGQIMFHASATLPGGSPWLLCDGSIVLRVDYPDLFTAIGTTYNTGGESGSQFRLPDLRGRVLAGVNDGAGRLPTFADSLGGTGGESDHTLVTSEIPAHSHTSPAHSHTSAPPTAGFVNVSGGPTLQAARTPSTQSTSSVAVTIDNTGGDGAHNNTQPTIVMYAYILAVA